MRISIRRIKGENMHRASAKDLYFAANPNPHPPHPISRNSSARLKQIVTDMLKSNSKEVA